MHCKSLWIKASAKCINVNVSKEKHIMYLKKNIAPFVVQKQTVPNLHFARIKHLLALCKLKPTAVVSEWIFTDVNYYKNL